MSKVNPKQEIISKVSIDKNSLAKISNKFKSFKQSKGKEVLANSYLKLEQKVNEYEKRISNIIEKKNNQKYQKLDNQIQGLRKTLLGLEIEIGEKKIISELSEEKNKLLNSRTEMLQKAFDNSVELVSKKRALRKIQSQNEQADLELKFLLGLMRKTDKKEQGTLKLVAEYRDLENEILAALNGSNKNEEESKSNFFITQVF